MEVVTAHWLRYVHRGSGGSLIVMAIYLQDLIHDHIWTWFRSWLCSQSLPSEVTCCTCSKSLFVFVMTWWSALWCMKHVVLVHLLYNKNWCLYKITILKELSLHGPYGISLQETDIASRDDTTTLHPLHPPLGLPRIPDGCIPCIISKDVVRALCLILRGTPLYYWWVLTHSIICCTRERFCFPLF